LNKIKLKKLIVVTVFFSFLNCHQKREITVSTTENIDSLFSENKKKISVNKKIKNLYKIQLLLDTKKFDTIARNHYVDLASEYYTLGHNQKYFEIYKIVDKKTLQHNDIKGNVLANSNIAVYYQEKFDIDSAYFFYAKAIKISEKLKNRPYFESILSKKAILMWLRSDFLNSEALAVKALKLAQKNNNYLLTFECYLTIGNNQIGLKNYDKAIDYYNKAIEVTENLKSEPYFTVLKAQPYIYIASIYQIQNQHQKAIINISKALKFDNFKKSNKTMYCYLSNKLAYSKFKLGDKSSFKQFEETLKIADSISNIPVQITSKTYLGEYYLNQKDTLKANSYLNDAQLQAHKNNVFEDELTILKLLTLVNPQKESYFTNKYIHLNDSLQNVERTSRDKYARIEFETDQIVQEKKAIEGEKNEISNQFILYSTASGLSLLLLIIMVYHKNKNIKLEKLLRKQEQELNDSQIYNLMISNQQKMEEGKLIEKQRISRDLHDGIIGKLSSIRMNLYEIKYTQTPESIKKHLEHIAEMKNIEEEIRNLTHELNTTVFSGSDDFETMIKALFTELNNNPKTEININIDPRIDWSLIDINIKMNLYRIFQEALQNINKYADASIVTITIAKSETGISIQIADNGKGFDVTQTKIGIGLKNMAHRAMELRAQFSTESAQNKGTKINLAIPIEFNSFEF
jgi:signal transduction histidine kinase